VGDLEYFQNLDAKTKITFLKHRAWPRNVHWQNFQMPNW